MAKCAVSSFRPLIAVNACTQHLPGKHPAFFAGEKYVQAVAQGAGGLPLLIPALGEDLPMEQLLDQLDGILLTGSQSNIEPHHYHAEPSDPGTLHDPRRDATTLPLVRAAIDAGVPLLGICRGFQEMNVSMGGTLYQKLHETGLFMEHREDRDAAFEDQFGRLSHTIKIVPGGLLSGIWPLTENVGVNSLHGQGVKALAPDLRVEAVAEDGLIEAFSVKGNDRFALAVQWHPEWQWSPGAQADAFPFYQAILRAFGDACRARGLRRVSRSSSP